jgi:hypothetical protein
MRRTKWLEVVLSVLILLTAAGCKAAYSNAPSDFQDPDLVGTWEAHYMEWGIDRLVIRAEGTFKQVYRDRTVKDYVYETPWNEWWVERLPDGRVWVHLQGARYYLDGIEVAEREGLEHPGPEDQPNFWGETEPPPHSFYDPFGKEFLNMVGELVLNVRRTSSAELILHHMWASGDRGFAMIGGESEIFRRVETP